MIELIYLTTGIVIGVCSTLGIDLLYRWLNRMKNEIECLRNQLDYYRRMDSNWTEFNFWKKEQKKE